MKEYSRSLYIDRMNKGLETGDSYSKQTLETFIENSQKLKKKASSAMSRVDKKMHPVLRNLAVKSYTFLIRLAEATQKNVDEYKKSGKFMTSIYDSSALNKSTKDLNKASKDFLKLPDFDKVVI
jgi:hypothetical protein